MYGKDSGKLKPLTVQQLRNELSARRQWDTAKTKPHLQDGLMVWDFFTLQKDTY